MAVTALQQSRIRYFLGFPAKFDDVYPFLTAAIATIDGDTQAEARLAEILASLDLVEAKLSGAVLSTAGLKRVEDVEWFQGMASAQVRGIGRTYCQRLALLLGFDKPRADVFGGTGSGPLGIG